MAYLSHATDIGEHMRGEHGYHDRPEGPLGEIDLHRAHGRLHRNYLEWADSIGLIGGHLHVKRPEWNDDVDLRD